MLYTILDIETTGLMQFDSNAELIPDLLEVAYILVDSSTLRIIKGGTLYFYQHHFDIENDAQMIHKLDRKFLMQFEDQFEENLIALAALTTNAVIMGKNSKKFDIPFIKHFLEKYKGKMYDIGDITSRVAMKNYDKSGYIYHESNVTHIDIQDWYAPVYRVKKFLSEIGEIGTFYDKSFTLAKFNEIHEGTDKRKRGSLTDYIDSIPDGRKMTQQLYDTIPKERETVEHGALYDVCMTYVVYLDYILLKGRLK